LHVTTFVVVAAAGLRMGCDGRNRGEGRKKKKTGRSLAKREALEGASNNSTLCRVNDNRDRDRVKEQGKERECWMMCGFG
jgi:hypothetical protein